jgi:hypothetical protein
MQSKTFALPYTPVTKLGHNAGPIEHPSIAQNIAATMFMPSAVILSVGTDLSLSRSESLAWQSAGYRVTAVGSIRDAIDYIRYGDFDLVLMGNSIRICDRERLTLLIRALGSRVPVVCVTDSSSDCAAFADATVSNEPIKLLQCIGELLAAQAGKPAANRAIPRAHC